MKRFLSVVMFLVIFVSFVYGGWFPITAWGIKHDSLKDTTWVDDAKVWHANSVKISNRGYTITGAFLDKGERDSLKFIVQGLTYGGGVPLSVMACSQFSTYESEAHDSSTYYMPGYFDIDSCIGDTISNPQASGGYAWACSVDVHSAGYMQTGLSQHKGHRQEFVTFPYEQDTLMYEARFYLRIPNTVGQEDEPVCRLEVYRDSVRPSLPDTILASQTIYRNSFSDTSAYETFSLWFQKDISMETSDGKDYSPMDYRIYWYDNYDLYADKVELRDTIFYNLEEGYYNTQINQIVIYWNGYPALAYYYLWDEPHLDQFKAFQLIKLQMGDGKPIECLSVKYKDDYRYNYYIDFIKTSYAGDNNTPLLVDQYVLTTQDTTPSLIQGKFSYLCAWMDTVREIADTTGPGNPHRDVWYICQAHRWRRRNPFINSSRDPTPEEMWALAGLGFAHGAKGIWYYRYKSQYYGSQSPPNPDSMYIHGLVDWNPDGSKWVHNNKWEATQDINAVIQDVDTFLLDFTFQNGFRGNNLQNYIKYISLDSLSEFGLFEDSDNLKYFLIVNRTDNYDPGDTTYPDTTDSTIVTLGLDGYLYNDSYYIRDCYSGEAYSYDSTGGTPEALTLYFKFYLKDCHFKLFQLVPFTADVEINSDSSYTDYRFVKINFDTSTSLSLGANDTIYMTVWDDDGDTIKDVEYDSTIIWQFDSSGNRIITASFKIVSSNYIQGDSGYLTPTYCDTIYLDTIPPTSNSLEVEDVDTLAGFVNEDSVDLELESTDASGPAVRKMRFSNYGFSNLIQNPDFDTTTFWVCVDSAFIDSGYGEIDGDYGGKIYQNLGDTLLVDDAKYRLWVYVVTDSFTSDSGRIRASYMYVDTLSGDTTYSTLKIIDISSGDNVLTGYNCVSDTFTYSPSPGSDDTTFGCRVEAEQGNSGAGRLIVDEFLLEREYTEPCWHDYDTTYANWALTSGNGEKIVSGEFRDAAGNITIPVSDTIILDETEPVDTITSPRNHQIISGIINIRGWAYDAADPDSYFYYYKLEYKPTSGGDWNDCDTIEYYYEPKYTDPNQFVKDSSVVLGEWNTSNVQNGIYYLRLSVVDSASNLDSTRITVSVNNQGKGGSGEFKAGKEPTGISWSSHLYVTDIMDGDLRKYNLKGDSIGYFTLLKDSLGKNSPCAIATDTNGIWVADKHNHTVTCYDYTGDTLFTLGGYGDEKGEFNEPTGIDLFNDKVFVTDRYNHRVQVFKNDTFLFSFGTKGDSAGRFNEPVGIAVDEYGCVYVADRNNNRIELFDTTGKYIDTFGKDVSFNHPTGLVVDSYGYVFVIDEENYRIIELDPFGFPIYEMGEKGDGFGQFLKPYDGSISCDGKKLFVTDSEQSKVIVFKIYEDNGGGAMSIGDGETPIYNCFKACYPVPFSKNVYISYSIEKKGFVSMKVYDVTGRFVKKLVYGVQDRGWYTIQWDSNKQNRKSIASGVYFIRLEIDNFISTRKVLLLK